MRMKLVTEIAAAWAGALAQDAGIAAWAQDKYGAGVTVFCGADARSRPGKSQCPWLLVDPVAAATGLEEGTARYRLVLVACVAAAQGGREEATGGGLVTYTAQADADALAGLALDVLAGLEHGPEAVESMVYDEEYPLVMVGCEIETTIPLPIDGARGW